MKNSHTSSLSRDAKERRRLKAGELFKAGMRQADVARKLKVTPAAVHGWYHTWKEQGVRGLKSKGPAGFSSSFTEKDKKKLKRAILGGARKFGYDTDLWTLDRISAAMRQVAKKSFSTAWTWHIVTGLGFTPQKPEAKSKERNEDAIRTWTQRTFPRLKKMGAKTRISTGFSG